ncbi:MAG: DUF58 domain-containing protein [Armatimonadetes bacterium]|nr:DUF58 domain-containing protein [Armatimonadota bacterium]NIM23152.1 DUF58 domain-containing protein [Armatimonadota bacterium]NIM67020.1 DUF58 domain-containing protein [Armatimonadota bacterium]NIM75554.1 DUF58 domain-containing protein [Armatimonadota bacterium]NIN05209.1 DUF58 domain-containing protein [Armatimonadota bacterium]
MNNLLWILLALLALVLAWLAESIVLAWVSCVFMLILIASRILAQLSPPIEAKRALSTTHIQLGEEASVSISLRQQRRSWGWLQVSEAAPFLPVQGECGIMLSPGARKEREFTYSVKGTRRGYFPLGPLRLRYGDGFGFAEKRQTLLAPESITVLPRIVDLGRVRLPVVRAPGELQTMRRTFEDSTRPAGIRPYRQGDPLRRVHWRATAHSGRPQSKLYDVCTTLQAMIVFNLYRPDYPSNPAQAEETSEIAVSLTASLAVHLLSASQRVGVISNGLDVRERDEFLRDADVTKLPDNMAEFSDEFAAQRRAFLPPSRKPEQSLEILALLARLQPVKGRSLKPLLEGVRIELSWGEMLIVITPSIETTAVESLVGIAHAGFPVLGLAVGDSPSATRAHLRLAAAGIPSRKVTSQEDIGGLFA